MMSRLRASNPMPPAPESTGHEFGAYLKAQRVARGMSIADLSRVTRINMPSLERIEVGAWSELPAEVFVVGFVRAYATALTLDANATIVRYRQHRAATRAEMLPVEQAEAYGASRGMSREGRRRLAQLASAVLLLSAVALVLLLFHHGR
jgi:cytoskeletal protein RodZ